MYSFPVSEAVSTDQSDYFAFHLLQLYENYSPVPLLWIIGSTLAKD